MLHVILSMHVNVKIRGKKKGLFLAAGSDQPWLAAEARASLVLWSAVSGKALWVF